MREIDSYALAGYVPDPAGTRRLQRPYLVPSVVGVGLFLYGFARALFTSELHYLLLCLIGWGMFFGAMMLMRRAKPKSPLTGHPLQQYRYVGHDAAPFEIAYVDHDAKTYFRKILVPAGSHF